MEERFLNLNFTDTLLNIIRKIETLKQFELTRDLNLINIDNEKFKKITKNNEEIIFKGTYEICLKNMAIEIINNYIPKKMDKEIFVLSTILNLQHLISTANIK